MMHQTVSNNFPPDAALGAIWREHHRYLLNIAYRMMGSVSEAEDIVQEAFTKLLRVDITEIEDMRGWLVVATTRLCLDELRSAKSRREVYVGPWLPEPVIPPPDMDSNPVDRVTLDDSVRMAMLLVLERLSPAERAAFVLHDVFQFSFEEVAKIVGRTPVACRQLASRARRQVKSEASPSRFQVDPDELSRVADRFIAAANNGDLEALVQVLDANVAGHTDSGGFVASPRKPLVGRENVAPLFLRFLQELHIRLEPMPVNGEPGVLAYQDGRLVAVIALEFKNGLISQVHGVANPFKLAYAASILDVPTGELSREKREN
jgi:RNA polymerase sigma-70 factor (ECF subfamily)